MRVAIFAAFGVWTPHIETDLEIAERHLEAGDEVVWIRCDEAHEICEVNGPHARKTCFRCRSRSDIGIGLLNGTPRVIELSTLVSPEVDAELDRLPKTHGSVDDLRAFRVDEFDAGWAALSSTVWIHRDPEVDLAGDDLYRFLRAAVRAYRAAQTLYQSESFDRVYVFNGRMAPMRGALRAAQQMGIECHVHERGSSKERYGIFENAMPHDIAPTIARIHKTWDDSPLSSEEKGRIATGWFDGRASGFGGAWKSFTKSQRADVLPKTWDASQRNVVYYTSSEHEFAAIGDEWSCGLYPSPLEAAIALAEAASAQGSVHLSIRVHPNPDGARSSSVKRLLDIDLPRVTVVAPESRVSTYALMAAADVVVSSGSTAGIEAIYHGTPSINIGTGLYYGLGATHEPANADELWKMIEDPELALGPMDKVLRYGFYQATFGEPFRYFEPEDLFHGTFKGARVRGGAMVRVREEALKVLDLVAPRRYRVR